MYDDTPAPQNGKKENPIKTKLIAIVVALLALVIFAINDSGKHWYYMLLTRADLSVKVYNDTLAIRGLKVYLDKDSAYTGTNGIAVFESAHKGNHQLYIKFDGDSVKKTINIPDTAKSALDKETFNQTKSPAVANSPAHPPHQYQKPPADRPVRVITVDPVKVDTSKKVVAAPPTPEPQPALKRTFPETYCKRQHYILFDSLKVWVDEVHINESTANVQICYTETLNANCTNVIEEDVPIKLGVPFVFADRKKGYKLKLSRFQNSVSVYLILEQYDKPFLKE